MTGFSGVINDSNQDLDELSDSLVWLGYENLFNFKEENVKITISLHDISEDEPPAEANDGDVLIWVLGEVYGHDDGKEYTAKYIEYPHLSDSEYCARLYEKYRVDFVEGLNSNFAGVMYERDKNQIILFTDRLSARPIFYTKPTKNSLVFSTSLQSIVNHHSLRIKFDMHGLYDFFKYGIVYGLKTVLKGVKQLHPGSILRYDLNTNKLTRHIYWKPKYDPLGWSYDKFVDDFYRTFKKVYSEQTAKNQSYGLLLSGGGDSRLIASLVEEKTPCYNLNENMNKESKTAKLVTNKLNLEFNFLQREIDYYPFVLEKTSSISNLNNWFDKAHWGGFIENFRKKSDCMLGGHFADTILGLYIPNLSFNLPLIGKIDIPFKKNYSNFSYFKKFELYSRNDSIPKYLNLKSNFDHKSVDTSQRKSVNKFQQVMHNSLADLQMGFWTFYPLTNKFNFISYYTLINTMNVGFPFLDNRIIEFSQKLPIKYLLRRDIVKSALCKYERELAKIPRPYSGLTLCESELLHLLAKDFPNFIQKIKYSSTVDSSSWPDQEKVIRKSKFVEDKLKEKSKILKDCDFISKRKAWDTYNEHMQGKDRRNEIYPLLTLLENPITEKILWSKEKDK